MTIMSLHISVSTANMTADKQFAISAPVDYYYGEYYYGEYDYYEFEDNYYYNMYKSLIYMTERPQYMHVWGILVLITFLANILVIFALLQQKIRNPTNMILSAIAITDSLTGLVTLPTYWMVYEKYHKNNDLKEAYDTKEDFDSYYLQNLPQQSPEEIESKDEAFMSQSLCRGYLISKFFLSKTFHTMSIWLTLLLGIQRFISVAAPHRAKLWFSKFKVIVICIIIAVLAPLLHIYHLVDEKTDNFDGRRCEWDLEKQNRGNFVFLVISFLLRQFIPCVLLVLFTALFIRRLTKTSARLRGIGGNRGNASMQRRHIENRRTSLIVTLIVIAFLIPELPYGIYLFYVVIVNVANVRNGINFNTMHIVYEFSFMISAHANIYIYTFFNTRFRKHMRKVVFIPMLTCC